MHSSIFYIWYNRDKKKSKKKVYKKASNFLIKLEALNYYMPLGQIYNPLTLYKLRKER